MFSEDCRARLSGCEKNKLEEHCLGGHSCQNDSHRSATTESRRQRKIPSRQNARRLISLRSAAMGRKKKKSRSENPDWATKPHNRTGRCMPEHAASGDARQASQVQGWQTRSLGAAILILGDGRGGQRETCPRECSCSLKIPQCDGCKTCLRKCI